MRGREIMRQILAIAWKDLHLTYTDRSLLLIMIVTPLALATIIGLAFSGAIRGSDVPVRDIPVAVVNLDEGVEQGGQLLRLGDAFPSALVPPADAQPAALEENALFTLTNAVALDSADSARAAVDRGEYAAAIIVPPEFSRSLVITSAASTITPVQIEVYTSPTATISGGILRSVTEQIANTIASGSITVAATIDAIVQTARQNPSFGIQQLAASARGEFPPDFSAAFSAQEPAIPIAQQTISGNQVTFNPLVLFGSAQAIFFMMFTAMNSAISMLEEQRNGTLPRMLTTPTRRSHILIGKMLGTLANCVVQVLILVLALTLVGSLLSGQMQFIWGTNVLLVLAVILAVSLAASGLGALVTALVRTPEQGNVIGGLISMVFGLLGGAFFSTGALGPVAQLGLLTPNRWGVDALSRLSVGDTDIGLNLLVLTVFGAIFFVMGIVVFNRRLEG